MGRSTADSMASEWSLEAGLEYHLLCNHFPPVPRQMVSVCIEAIQCFNDYGSDAAGVETVELPDGVSWKGRATIPVAEVISAFHLESWLDIDEGEYVSEPSPYWGGVPV